MDIGKVFAHDGRVTCILYIKEQDRGQPIFDQTCLIYLRNYVVSVVEDFLGMLWVVRLQNPIAYRIHKKQWLPQMLQQYKDYNVGPPPLSTEEFSLAIGVMVANKCFHCGSGGNEVVCQLQVPIKCWRERNYLVVNVSNSDKLKLVFDAMCDLIDIDNDMFHGSVNTYGSVAIQKYFARWMNGCIMLNEMERQSLVQNLMATIEKGMSQGIKVEVHTLDLQCLLSKVNVVLRENNVNRQGTVLQGESYVCTHFYITDASSSTIHANNID